MTEEKAKKIKAISEAVLISDEIKRNAESFFNIKALPYDLRSEALRVLKIVETMNEEITRYKQFVENK